MGAPYEIMAGPFEVYVAPIGEAFPLIDATPAGNWTKLGVSGSKSMTEEGVKVRPEQTVEKFRPLGTTGPRKAFRTAEDLMIEFTLADATLEAYSAILDALTVTDTAASAGVAGDRAMPLLRGPNVATFAMLIRGDGISPYATGVGESFNTQWEIPIVYQGDNPETVYVKGTPVGLKTTWTALVDDSSGFGTLRAQDAAPS